jgi:cytochrome c-type biogenesis protein CcmH/NrfG
VNKSFLLGGAVGLFVGLLVALFAYQIGRAGGIVRPTGPVVAAPTTGPMPATPAGMPPPAEAGPAQPGAPHPEIEARIGVLQQLVQADPSNHDAWVELGNHLFDLHRPQESVEAYTRALALQPDDPNVLTDQGIMYRLLQQYDRALANFQKASKIDPGHLQSLFNQGVVYGFDLHDKAKAEAAWNKLLQLAPGSADAARARAAMAELNAAP